MPFIFVENIGHTALFLHRIIIRIYTAQATL